MCGRARQSLAPEQVAAAAGAAQERWVDRERYRPSHNMAPGAWAPVVRTAQEDGQRTLHTMRWGLVPSFHKASEKPDHFRMFNARSETVDSKGIFKRLLGHKRCVVPMEGFYEWKADAGGKKQPYYVSLGQDEPMRMAGLFDAYPDEDGERVHTFTILTTDSSKRLNWLHDRMPVILRTEADAAAWLGEGVLHDAAANKCAEGSVMQQKTEGEGGAQEAVDAKEAGEALLDVDMTQEGEDEEEGRKEEAARAIAQGAALVHKLARPYNGEDLVWWPVTTAMSKMSYQAPDASKDIRAAKGAISNFFRATGVVHSSKAKGGAADKGSGGGSQEQAKGVAAGQGGGGKAKGKDGDSAAAAGASTGGKDVAGGEQRAGGAAKQAPGAAALAKAAEAPASGKGDAGPSTSAADAGAPTPGSGQKAAQKQPGGDAIRNSDDTNAAREHGEAPAGRKRPAAAAVAGKKQAAAAVEKAPRKRAKRAL